MKKILLIFALITAYITNAQVSSYSFTQSSGTYTALTTPTVLATATTANSLDSAIYPVTLPFNFSFNGVNYSSLNVSTNGFITFGGTTPSAFTSTPISSTEAYAGAVSAFGRDLNAIANVTSVFGTVSWGVVGTAPNREIVIQWADFRPTYTTSTTAAYAFSFQIRLRETAKTIAVVYKGGSYLAGTTTYSSTAQIGLRGANNADYNNRLNATTLAFGSSTAGTANNSSQAFNTTAATPGMPANGLTYTWTPPSCFGVSGLVATGMTTSSASISWLAPSVPPANGYDIYYSTTTTPPGTPQIINVPNTATSYVIPGLNAATTYYVWVRAKCSPTDQSPLVSPLAVYTGHCLPTGGSSSTTYYLNSVKTTGGWTNLNYSATSYSAYVNSNQTVLSSPGFNIGVNLATPSGTHYFYVWVDWNNDLDFNDPGETILATTTYTATATANIPIPAGQPLGTYKVRTSSSYIGVNTSCGPAPYGSYVDFNLSIVAPPTCLPPTGFTLFSATTTSATVQWTVPTPAPAGGYDVYYSTTNTPPLPTTTPQFSGVTGPNQLIGGLTPSTTYYVWVRARCSSSDISYWSGPVSVFTNYCTPTAGTSSTSYYLNNITTTGGLTNIAYTASSYTAYVNNSATSFSVIPGGSVNVSMATPTGTHYYYIWIDWNNNLAFEPLTETVYASTGYVANVATQISSGTRPPGSYRVRFTSSYIGTTTPCGPNAWGNYVDYTFVIKPCSTTAPTNVTVNNINNVSATVNWVQSPDNLNYRVYWRVAGTTLWANSSPILTPPTNNYVITGLQASTNYEVKVVAICNTTEGAAPAIPFSTTCDPTPPNVTVTQVTATSALVTWNPIVPNATYELRWRIVGSGAGGWTSPIGGTPLPPLNSYLITGLTSFTTYEVQVRSKCTTSTTPNPWSNPQVFTTVRICEVPPPGLTITTLTPTSAEITWDAFTGAGATGSYILRYRKVGIPSWTTLTVNTNTYTILGLLELTKYEMQVANVCSGTPGNFTPPYYFTTPTVVYCQMSSSNGSTEFINKVTVKPTGKPEMINETLIGPTPGYSDFTANPAKHITMIQGSAGNQITIDKTLSNGASAGVAVWIDFNRNGYFDINERILADGPNTNPTASATFSVPADAFVSMTDYKYVVMRVAMQKDGIPVNCTSFPNGEVEDYTVRISKQSVANAVNQTDILIYPNPVSTVLNVKNISKKANYKIYSAAGQVVSSGLILNNKIDVSRLINGLYVIDIEDVKGTVQKKFIKE
ncbi:fibronectin type III domain-containing protein [Chryseobacterium aquaticum]|uniref:fibronectin type III domain-containing protein n=1 Tax=Chryseobacterium aquaticum TaxID=452084 RepID=UPI0006FCB569|nr:fibronectin type III domain-containing protein [Chryseobacterium aquaticum]